MRLVIAEGEKKTAKLTEAGLPCVGIGGLWCWRHQGRVLPALAAIDWVRRPVLLVPDSDVWQRDDLLQPVYALGDGAGVCGAVVDVVKLPRDTKGRRRLSRRRTPAAISPKLPRLKLTEAPLTRVAPWWKGWSKTQGAGDEADQDALALLKGGTTTTVIHPAQAVLGDMLAYGVPTAGDLVLVTSERKLYTASDLPDGIVLHPDGPRGLDRQPGGRTTVGRRGDRVRRAGHRPARDVLHHVPGVAAVGVGRPPGLLGPGYGVSAPSASSRTSRSGARRSGAGRRGS